MERVEKNCFCLESQVMFKVYDSVSNNEDIYIFQNIPLYFKYETGKFFAFDLFTSAYGIPNP
ncbi:hypothetical protein CLW00_102333 [Mongoliibacter ruber]|uniref:Uncharacterized protein n=1 Tax=Mongoliibacter ruber TaxID=1750599 RepID=A0A2T0WT60_9BACT|nr:hypothetical protein CLW00_102333 [Mongoliibacter ruber]